MNVVKINNVLPYKKISFENFVCSGIYFVYENEKLLYIGQSNNIGYRIICYIRQQSHLSFPSATHVKFIEADDETERKALEAKLIKEYLPPMNYSHTGGKSERCLKIHKKLKHAISIDLEVYKKIKEFGEQQDRSFSQQVNKILKEYLKGLES